MWPHRMNIEVGLSPVRTTSGTTSSTVAGKVENCHDQVSNAAIHVYPALQLPRNYADEKLIIKLYLLKICNFGNFIVHGS